MSGIVLVSPGAMGTAIGKALLRCGHRIYCDVSQRSAVTQQRAERAGFVICEPLEAAFHESDVVLSLVPPSQALAVSRCFADCVAGHRSAPIFVDCNSVSPRTARAIGAVIAASGASAVDCSIFGPADELGTSNVVVVSGEHARTVAALFDGLVDVRIAEGGFGAASAIKMSISIITKSLPALFLEATCASAASGQLGLMVALFERLYPGIMSFINRSLPTYPRHVSRRLDEMREIESWLHDLGQLGAMTHGARYNLDRLHSAELSPAHNWDLLTLLNAVARRKILTQRQTASAQH